MKLSTRLDEALARVSTEIAEWTGSSWAFGMAIAVIAAWVMSGPLFGFSETWQLVINTGTTIVTFLMVFLLQRSQNKDARAVHIKLNEIVAVLDGASNRLIDVENLSEADLKTLHAHFRMLVEMAKRESSLTKSHSVEEAETRHRLKAKKFPRARAAESR